MEPGALPFPPKPVRVALVPDAGEVHPAVAQAVQSAGRLLAAAGYVVEEVCSAPPIPKTEAAQFVGRNSDGRYSCLALVYGEGLR